MSLSEFPNVQNALVEQPSGPTLEDCGRTGQLPGMNVCNSVRVKQCVDERVCVLGKYSQDNLRQKPVLRPKETCLMWWQICALRVGLNRSQSGNTGPEPVCPGLLGVKAGGFYECFCRKNLERNESHTFHCRKSVQSSRCASNP